MAYDTTTVDVGMPTKKSHFDQLLANDAYLKTRHEVGHNAASGQHLISDLDAVKYASTVGGTADAITLNFTPAVLALVAGLEISFKAAAQNTGAVTVAVEALGATNVKKNGDSALIAGDIKNGQVVRLQYDGTQFQMQSQSGGASSGGILTWSIKTAAFNAVKGNGYICDTKTTGAITMTLPADPSAGDVVGYIDGASYFATNNLTIDRNGKKIMGLEEDMTCSLTGDCGELIYSDAANGWRLK